MNNLSILSSYGLQQTLKTQDTVKANKYQTEVFTTKATVKSSIEVLGSINLQNIQRERSSEKQGA